MDILLRSDKCWDIAHRRLAIFDIVGGFAFPPNWFGAPWETVEKHLDFNEGFIDAAAAVLRRATPFLLWLGGHRRRFRHDGNRSECANGVLSLLPAIS